jgi:hypothetical protein
VDWLDPRCFGCGGRIELRKGPVRRRFIFCQNEGCPLNQTDAQWKRYRDCLQEAKNEHRSSAEPQESK